MLAKGYGYWVSEDPAADVRLTGAWLREQAQEEPPAFQRKSRLAFVVSAFVALVSCIGGGLIAANEFNQWALALFVTGALALFYAWGFRPTREPVIPVSRPRFPQLAKLPWQAWPCQIEGPAPKSDDVAATVTLLDSHRRSVASFRGSVPAATWHRMTDGYGVLWICGDLRLRIAVADPGGAPIWLMWPVKDQVQTTLPSAGPNLLDVAAEEAVRQASASVTQSWLNELGFG